MQSFQFIKRNNSIKLIIKNKHIINYKNNEKKVSSEIQNLLSTNKYIAINNNKQYYNDIYNYVYSVKCNKKEI